MKESFQSARSRQHRSSRRQAESFFLLIVSMGQSLGHSLATKSTQPGRPAVEKLNVFRFSATSLGGQERLEQPNRASQGAQESQIEPARPPKTSPRASRATPKRPESAQERPKGTPERPKSAQKTFESTPRSPKSAPRAPNRGSQGAQEYAGPPNRSTQGDLDETLPLRSEINENTAHAQQNRRPAAPRAAR